MQINLKSCLLVLTLMFSGQSLNAICNEDLKDLDFKRVASGLKKRKLIQIADQEYAVCKELPKRYSSLYGEEVETNPCYEFGLGPKLLKPTDLENLPDPLPSFYAIRAAEDESGEFLTVGFTASNNPHWQKMFSSPVPMDKRYWNEVHTEHVSIPYFFVSFLLKKI